MRLCRFALPMIAAFACVSALAQAPDYGNIGRKPTDKEIQDWNIAIGPEGKELPLGSGTAKEGANIFSRQMPDALRTNVRRRCLIASASMGRTRYYKYASTRKDHRELLAICDHSMGLHKPRDAA